MVMMAILAVRCDIEPRVCMCVCVGVYVCYLVSFGSQRLTLQGEMVLVTNGDSEMLSGPVETARLSRSPRQPPLVTVPTRPFACNHSSLMLFE